jgi:hypothetical protein
MNASVHNETECEFVSTCGLSLICDQAPTYMQRQIKYNWNFDNNHGDIIYVKSSHMMQFLQQVCHAFKQPIIILTNGDDDIFPSDLYARMDLDALLSRVLFIFSQNNIAINHPKFKHIPIGIDYHTLNWESGEHSWGKTQQTAKQQELVLKLCKQKMNSIEACDPTVIITNFQLAMDSPPRRRVFREPIYQLLKDKNWMKFLDACTRKDFWLKLQNTVFVLCPPGNGMDTHRAWEVLMLGKIPIIQDLPINAVYQDLPVWIVKDWSAFAALSPNDFVVKHKHFIEQWPSYKFEKLTLKWWKDYIFEEKSRV